MSSEDEHTDIVSQPPATSTSSLQPLPFTEEREKLNNIFEPSMGSADVILKVAASTSESSYYILLMKLVVLYVDC